MNKENTLFSLVGVGFGLFFGFSFAFWANQRAHRAPRAADAGGAAASTADARKSQAQADASIKRARENPNDFAAQMEGARAYYEAGRYDESVGLLLNANKLQPTNVEPVVALGDVNADAGNVKVAEKWYAAALEMNPSDAGVRANLGRLFLLGASPDYGRAVAELRRALATDPRHEPALQYLVVALAQKGDTKGARETLAQLEKVNPENPSIVRLREEIEARALSPAQNGSRDAVPAAR